MRTYPAEGYPAELAEAQREANATRQHIAIYRKHNGEHYLVRTAHDVLPGSEHVCIASPTRCMCCGR